MDEKYTLSPTPAPTVEQQNRAWQDFHNDMNDLIKRYDIPILDGMMIGDGDDPNGEWVRYDDHAAALAEAQATIARLEDQLNTLRLAFHVGAAETIAQNEATITRLVTALREIIDASNNTGIEMGTVGMRVAERVEDIARAALSPREGEG